MGEARCELKLEFQNPASWSLNSELQKPKICEMVGAPDIIFVPAQFGSIQKAVDAASRATTIMVEPGYYNESVVVKDKESIVIVSTALSRRGVVITGGTGSDVFLIESSTVRLSGIVTRSDGRQRGIRVRDSSLSLQECVIACNRASNQVCPSGVGAGMLGGESSRAVGGSSLDILRGSDFSAAGSQSITTAGAIGAGMACWNSSVRIQKTAVIGNVVENVAGNMVERTEFRVQASACSNSTSSIEAGSPTGANIVEHSEETKNGALGGGLYFDSCRVEIAGCTIQANAALSATAARGGGIWCCNTRMRMWRSRVTDNTLRGAICEGGGIYFKDAASCQLGGSVITGNGFPEGCGGGIFIEGDLSAVSIHRNTPVKLNFPDDIHSASDARGERWVRNIASRDR